MASVEERESDFDLSDASEFVIFRPNHQLMARPRLREQDLQPQRIFFYKRLTDQQILIFTEQEASLMAKSSHAQILQQIGCSDGTAYTEKIRSSGLKPGQSVKREEAQKVLQEALDAEIESARGKFANPLDQNVHFDDSFPIGQRPTFVPPR